MIVLIFILNGRNNYFIVVLLMLVFDYWRQFEDIERGYIHQSGHFSLINEFNPTTDDVLILDQNMRKFSHHRLSVKDLVFCQL